VDVGGNGKVDSDSLGQLANTASPGNGCRKSVHVHTCLVIFYIT